MTSTAQALVLDFGGVVTRTLFETHDLTEKVLGLEPGALRWRGPFDPGGDPLWRSQQAGEITERAYWLTRTREVGRLVGEDWDRIEQFLQRVRGPRPLDAVRPEALTAIAAARAAGRRLAILSNELDLFYGADFRGKLPFLEDFDLIVDATYTGILKPDRRAYEAVIEGLGIAPPDCVFVDDQPRNVRGAEAAGMTAIQFDVTDPAASYAIALARLGLTPIREDRNDAA